MHVTIVDVNNIYIIIDLYSGCRIIDIHRQQIHIVEHIIVDGTVVYIYIERQM